MACVRAGAHSLFRSKRYCDTSPAPSPAPLCGRPAAAMRAVQLYMYACGRCGCGMRNAARQVVESLRPRLARKLVHVVIGNAMRCDANECRMSTSNALCGSNSRCGALRFAFELPFSATLPTSLRMSLPTSMSMSMSMPMPTPTRTAATRRTSTCQQRCAYSAADCAQHYTTIHYARHQTTLRQGDGKHQMTQLPLQTYESGSGVSNAFSEPKSATAYR